MAATDQSIPPSDRAVSVFVRDKLFVMISGILLGTAIVSWIASYYLMPVMMAGGDSSGMMEMSGVAATVSSPNFYSIGLYEVVWVVGMAAMMFPAMIPIVMLYNKAKTKLETNPMLARFVGTPLFLSGYLITYAILGIGAYFAVYAAFLFSSIIHPASVAAYLGTVGTSAVLIATGIYQFSSLKTRCLSQCVSPLGFFALHSRSGLSGALRMGFAHGAYCAGCCWAYMLVMLALGAMSIPVMAVLAGLVALEKAIIRGSAWFNRLVAVGFVSFGILVGFFPNIFTII